jgi:hypothetical protein
LVTEVPSFEMAQSARLPNSPFLVGTIALGAWLVFVLVRLLRLADGDIGYFVLAGTEFTDASAGLPLLDGAGYDGQFFYRLAVNPFDAGDRVGGTILDSSWRAVRIGYPLLAWVVGFAGVPASWALVIVNLVAVATLGYLGGHIARSAGRDAIWGLLLPMYFGFAFSIARDLAEVVATTALVGGVVLGMNRRHLAAGLCFSLAVLSRETMVTTVLVIGLVELGGVIRRRRSLGSADAIWVLPFISFSLWQLVVVFLWDQSLLDIGGNTGSIRIPGSALIEQLPVVFSASYLGDGMLNIVHAVEVCALLAVVLFAAFASTRSGQPRILSSAFVGLAAMLLTVDVPIGIWTDRNDLRMFAGVYAVAVIILLRTNMRLHLLALVIAVCTGAAALSFVVGA